VWLSLYLMHLASRGFANLICEEELPRCQRFVGDFLELGKGEVLVRRG